MTDIELTRLCAEAMGLTVLDNSALRLAEGEDKLVHVDRWKGTGLPFVYDPLHDDAQAMALVKKFRMEVADVDWNDEGHQWGVSYFAPDYGSRPDDFAEPPHSRHVQVIDAELSRAIVHCVSKMMQQRMTQQRAGG